MVKQGQIIKIDFSPSVGYEQGGYRPAVVVNNDFGLARHNMVYICPITNTNKPYPTHIPLDDRTKTTGVVLCEHMKSADLSKKVHSYVEDMPPDIFEKVVFAVSGLIRLPE
jgi:mRNA interferase MazF